MADEIGGGASKSTQPASGTSAPTDVSLREFVAVRLDALDRHVTAELAALRRETEAANLHADRAIEVAAHEAAERLAAHNGLIDQMQAQQSTFATRESLDDFKETNNQRIGRLERFQYIVTGATMLALALGLSTLVKLLTE